jgi:hypothetical protein
VPAPALDPLGAPEAPDVDTPEPGLEVPDVAAPVDDVPVEPPVALPLDPPLEELPVPDRPPLAPPDVDMLPLELPDPDPVGGWLEEHERANEATATQRARVIIFQV